MAIRQISFLDEKTGEVMLDGQLVWQSRRTRSPFGRDWFSMAQPSAEDMAFATREMGSEAQTVMWLLFSRLDYENYIHVVQEEISQKMNMKQPNVSRAISKLINYGILIQGPRSGKAKTYRLNPNFVWRGSTHTHRRALNDAPPLRIVRTKRRNLSERRAELDEAERHTINLFTGKTEAEVEQEMQTQLDASSA